MTIEVEQEADGRWIAEVFVLRILADRLEHAFSRLAAQLCPVRPHPHNIRIVRAKSDDAAMLTGIAFAAKRHWGYPERWIQKWSELLTIQPEFIVTHETHAAVVDGRTVGFYSLSCKHGTMRLEHLWVLPEVMYQGIGRALFAHAVERVRDLGFKTFEIESDPNATRFYQHMGAHRIGASITELDGQARELPVLVYEIDHVA